MLESVTSLAATGCVAASLAMKRDVSHLLSTRGKHQRTSALGELLWERGGGWGEGGLGE